MAEYAQAYDQSQYVMGEKKNVVLSDDQLYVYAGYVYLLGEDPTHINFEHPPMGKYIFGISYLIFGNPYTLNIIIFGGILMAAYFLFLRLKMPTWWILASLIFLSFASSLNTQITTALLDMQLLLASLLFFNFLFLKKENFWKYILLGLSLGIVSSLKYFFPLLFIYLLILLIYVVKKKTYAKSLITLAVIGLIYISNYIFFFKNDKNLIDWLKFEIYRFRWWTGGRTGPKFLIFQTLLFGQYTAWWDDPTKIGVKQIIKSEDWNFLWPVAFVSQAVCKIWLIVKNKLNFELWLCLIYSVILLLAYGFGSASADRYLIQLIPFWLIFVGAVIKSGSSKITHFRSR